MFVGRRYSESACKIDVGLLYVQFYSVECSKYKAAGQCLKDLAAGIQSKQVEMCVAGHDHGGWHVAGDVRSARC